MNNLLALLLHLIYSDGKITKEAIKVICKFTIRKNKMLLKKSLIAFALLLALPIAHAATFGLDNKIGEALLGNSGDATEKQALADALGIDVSEVTLVSKVSSGIGATQNEGTIDEWFIDVAPAEPGFYLLKFGIGGISATADTFFFENVAELTKLVWSNSQVQGITGSTTCNNCNIGRLSHYTSLDVVGDPQGDPLPEPGIMLLFSLGLAAFGFAKRSRKS